MSVLNRRQKTLACCFLFRVSELPPRCSSTQAIARLTDSSPSRARVDLPKPFLEGETKWCEVSTREAPALSKIQCSQKASLETTGDELMMTKPNGAAALKNACLPAGPAIGVVFVVFSPCPKRNDSPTGWLASGCSGKQAGRQANPTPSPGCCLCRRRRRRRVASSTTHTTEGLFPFRSRKRTIKTKVPS